MLQAQGAHNINLVNPTHYLPWVRDALQLARLRVPVVWNSGGYERAEALRAMEGLVDIYLPDLKYAGSVRAERYSGASDYWAAATKAIREMHRQTGKPVWDASGLLRKGVVIRHLVLPKGVQDAAAVLDWIAGTFLPGEVLVSLMSQYTPCGDLERFPELRRRVSSYEYKIVLAHAQSLGLEGFMQERSSAREEYTPPFDLEGVWKRWGHAACRMVRRCLEKGRCRRSFSRIKNLRRLIRAQNPPKPVQAVSCTANCIGLIMSVSNAPTVPNTRKNASNTPAWKRKRTRLTSFIPSPAFFKN